MWLAMCGASSAGSPERIFTTLPGRSLVAMISEKVRAGSGWVAEVSTTAALPLRMTGATNEARGRSGGSLGQSTTTTPVGSGRVKLKCELATGFTELKTWLNLSVQPA